MCCKTRSHTLLHYGPVVTILLISGIASNTISVLHNLEIATGQSWSNVRIPFIAVVLGITLCYFSAVFMGGGSFPANWRPKNKDDEKFLQTCKICEGFKPPRSHHCHECGTCVPKLDHHCPWINSCVGNRNHLQFVGFVTLVPIGCFGAALIQGYFLYLKKPPMGHLNYYARYNPAAFQYLLITLFSFVFAVAVAIAVGGLAVFQYYGIYYNQTQIEGWIVEKADRREREKPFVFPYELGLKGNIVEFFHRWANGNGIEWTVGPGCDQYTFTREQLAQKAAKRAKTRTVVLNKPIGRFRGCEFGVKVWWNGPGFMEPHVKAEPDDIFNVWNYGDDWYYGERVVEKNGKFKAVKPRQRGWFPGDAISEMLERGAKGTARGDQAADATLDDDIPKCT